MALVQVQKNGTTMTVDSANLSTWTSAGWSQVGGGSSAPAPAPAPAPVQQPTYQPTYQPPSQPAYNSPMPANAGNIDLSKYGISNADGVGQQQLAALGQDYDDLKPVMIIQNGVYKAIGYEGTPIPKATVVSPSGERVTVRTDNKPGKYRTLAEMQQQGYKMESAPGVSADQTYVSSGAQVVGQRPALQLKDGTIVNSNDPNYDKYKSISGVKTIDNTQKQILNDNGKLYAWDGKNATYIPDQKTLSNYVGQGFLDTRANFQGVTGQPGSMSGAQGTVITPGSSPQPIPTQGGQVDPASIPFKASLSADQKQSITQLVQNKPDVSTWTAQDKTNWAYATNNASLPQSGAGVPGGQADFSGSGSSGTGGATGKDGGFSVDPVDRNWINQLYQKYFDRDATTSEMSNWARENPQALEQFLGSESKKYNYTSKYFQQESTQRLDQAMKIIDGSDLPSAIKDLWKTVVQGYPPGMEYNSQEILSTFQKIKDQTIDPQFRELTNVAMNDFKTQVDSLSRNREMEMEAERTAAGQNIRQTKEGLEKSGMTFTGKAIEELGKDAAYQQPGANPASQLPDQLPFGGMFYEGNANQKNRLMATSSQSRYNDTLQSLGSAAETKLGTGAASSLGIPYKSAGNITGELETQKQSQYGSTLNQIIDNFRQKQTLNTNPTAR